MTTEQNTMSTRQAALLVLVASILKKSANVPEIKSATSSD
jgi:hypothetical protein